MVPSSGTHTRRYVLRQLCWSLERRLHSGRAPCKETDTTRKNRGGATSQDLQAMWFADRRVLEEIEITSCQDVQNRCSIQKLHKRSLPRIPVIYSSYPNTSIDRTFSTRHCGGISPESSGFFLFLLILLFYLRTAFTFASWIVSSLQQSLVLATQKAYHAIHPAKNWILDKEMRNPEGNI